MIINESLKMKKKRGGGLPFRLKNSCEYFPENATDLGISPRSSMI